MNDDIQIFVPYDNTVAFKSLLYLIIQLLNHDVVFVTGVAVTEDGFIRRGRSHLAGAVSMPYFASGDKI